MRLKDWDVANKRSIHTGYSGAAAFSRRGVQIRTPRFAARIASSHVHRWKVWGAAFLVWVFFLSGIFSDLTGTPGAVQALRLRSLLDQKKQELRAAEARVSALDLDRNRLMTDPLTQRREIRKVLGYVAPNEIVFDFESSSN